MKTAARAIGSALLLLAAESMNGASAQTRPDIRLVLQVTVDGLRADLLNRYAKGFGEGGFRYLKERGAYFTNAHYQHANTETIVGHATLATGTFPSHHGMIGNVWFDREAGELAYNYRGSGQPDYSDAGKGGRGRPGGPGPEEVPHPGALTQGDSGSDHR